MKLRKLKISDAENMLEWMHDEELCKHMHADFSSKKLEDCKEFIKTSSLNPCYVHFAIVDDNDRYMGTVSLKNIQFEEGIAEFGIVVRRCAMGKGYSQFGMREIIKYGFNDLNLKQIIWCVSKFNLRANRFYVKNGYSLISEGIPSSINKVYKNVDNLVWYGISKNEISRIN